MQALRLLYRPKRQGFYSLLVALLLFIPAFAIADGDLKARYGEKDRTSLRLAPIQLSDGGRLNLISPPHYAATSRKLGSYLRRTHKVLGKLLGPIPSHETEIRLMDQEHFFEVTGAPRWTNAMYYRNKIVIPIDPKKTQDMSGLARAVRHEYVHAVMNVLSAGRCPGWLDEGFAQWIEGEENPSLAPSLNRWLLRREPIPLVMLKGGFTGLDDEMVPPAYAQALFASQMILDKHGFSGLRKYVDNLRRGHQSSKAFRKAFGLEQRGFEDLLGEELRNWAREKHSHVAHSLEEAQELFDNH